MDECIPMNRAFCIFQGFGEVRIEFLTAEGMINGVPEGESMDRDQGVAKAQAVGKVQRQWGVYVLGICSPGAVVEME